MLPERVQLHHPDEWMNVTDIGVVKTWSKNSRTPLWAWSWNKFQQLSLTFKYVCIWNVLCISSSVSYSWLKNSQQLFFFGIFSTCFGCKMKSFLASAEFILWFYFFGFICLGGFSCLWVSMYCTSMCNPAICIKSDIWSSSPMCHQSLANQTIWRHSVILFLRCIAVLFRCMYWNLFFKNKTHNYWPEIGIFFGSNIFLLLFLSHFDVLDDQSAFNSGKDIDNLSRRSQNNPEQHLKHSFKAPHLLQLVSARIIQKQDRNWAKWHLLRVSQPEPLLTKKNTKACIESVQTNFINFQDCWKNILSTDK